MGLTGDKFEMNVNVSTKAVQDTLDELYHLLNDVDDLGDGKYDGIPMCISTYSLKHINQHMDDLYSMFNLEPPKIDNPFE